MGLWVFTMVVVQYFATIVVEVLCKGWLALQIGETVCGMLWATDFLKCISALVLAWWLC